MNLIDAILITLVSTIICFAFPKLLSIILTLKDQPTRLSKRVPTLSKAGVQLTSFPYCTSYVYTKRPFCKFSPSFCNKCSP
jgi:hypothetical protein